MQLNLSYMKNLMITRPLAHWLLALFLAAGLPAFAEEEEVAPIEITLRIDQGWRIEVHNDGSGNVAYGSTFGDIAFFPKGTIAFGRLLQTAKGRKKVDSQDPGRVHVWFTKPGQVSNVAESRAMVEDWEALCRQILPHLESMNPERLNQLLNKRPLAKDLPEASVKMMESPPKSPKPRPRKEK
jgi:hypothetical protein